MAVQRRWRPNDTGAWRSSITDILLPCWVWICRCIHLLNMLWHRSPVDCRSNIRNVSRGMLCKCTTPMDSCCDYAGKHLRHVVISMPDSTSYVHLSYLSLVCLRKNDLVIGLSFSGKTLISTCGQSEAMVYDFCLDWRTCRPCTHEWHVLVCAEQHQEGISGYHFSRYNLRNTNEKWPNWNSAGGV